MDTMYVGKINSPITQLASGIDDVVTSVPLVDASKLPSAPNLAVLGLGEDSETILYTGISTNTLTGVTRGFQGTAKAWSSGTLVARTFTTYDHDTFKANITALDSAKINHALATAANDFLVASGSGAFVKKTLAETRVILGTYTEIAPSSITPTTVGNNWETWDISAIVPAGTLVVEVRFYGAASPSSYVCGARKYGSSAARYWLPGQGGLISDATGMTFLCQVSADRKIDVMSGEYLGTKYFTYSIIGYWS